MSWVLEETGKVVDRKETFEDRKGEDRISMKEKSEAGSKICILVTSSPESENNRTLVKITEAAINIGHQVQIFLMCDGVYHILCQDFLPLIKKGAEVSLCAQNALER